MTKSKQNLLFLIILSAFMAFTSLSTDIYLPAMPAMQTDLGGNSERTVTGFLIGFSIAQLIWGPISVAVGRKVPLYIGTVLFIIGSIGCALAPSMWMVVFWRIVQALGACVGPMLSRTMIRDLYPANQVAQILSTLVMIMAVAPIVGPFLGGILLKMSSWRLIFWFMALIGAVLFVSVKALPETLQEEHRGHLSLNQAFKNYGKLLTSKKFMVYTLSVTFFYVAIYAFITGSSAVYITRFHVAPEHYTYYFSVNIIGLTLVSMLNRHLVTRFNLPTLLKMATGLAFLFSVLLVVLAANNLFGIWGIVVPMFLVFSTNGIVAACANAAALAEVDDNLTGSAGALIGSLQYGSGIISSILLAIFDGNPTMSMVLIILVAILLSALTSQVVREK